jgi:hypothetical protein
MMDSVRHHEDPFFAKKMNNGLSLTYHKPSSQQNFETKFTKSRYLGRMISKRIIQNWYWIGLLWTNRTDPQRTAPISEAVAWRFSNVWNRHPMTQIKYAPGQRHSEWIPGIGLIRFTSSESALSVWQKEQSQSIETTLKMLASNRRTRRELFAFFQPLALLLILFWVFMVNSRFLKTFSVTNDLDFGSHKDWFRRWLSFVFIP